MAPTVELRKYLVIGYGSTIRGDDGLGPCVAESLREATLPRAADVRIMVLPQLDITLAAEMNTASRVIFVDARSDDNEEPVTVGRVWPAERSAGESHTSHSIRLPDLLRLALDWYGAAPECHVVMPKGYDFSIRETISERAAVAAALAKEKVIEILQS